MTMASSSSSSLANDLRLRLALLSSVQGALSDVQHGCSADHPLLLNASNHQERFQPPGSASSSTTLAAARQILHSSNQSVFQSNVSNRLLSNSLFGGHNATTAAALSPQVNPLLSANSHLRPQADNLSLGATTKLQSLLLQAKIQSNAAAAAHRLNQIAQARAALSQVTAASPSLSPSLTDASLLLTLAAAKNLQDYPSPASPSELLAAATAQASVPSAAATSQQASTTGSVTRTLNALGSCRRQKADAYVDCASLPLQVIPKRAPPSSKRVFTKPRGGVSEPFPEKVYRMLVDTAEEGLHEVVSFLPHGRAFRVHDIDRFVAEILPRYFQQTKWTSFTRQLNLWGFCRITSPSSPDVGGFYHELFLRGKSELLSYMKRVGVPSSGIDRRRIKAKAAAVYGGNSRNADPDFYAMKTVG